MLRTLLVLCCALTLGGCWSSDEPSAEEKRLLLTNEDFRVEDIGGRYSRMTLYVPSATSDLNFTSNEAPGFHLSSTFSTSATPAEAMMKTLAYDVPEGRELPLKGDYGPRAKLLLLANDDGRPIGNAFFFSSGQKSFYTMFLGIHFPDAESFEAFIAPKVAAVKAYEVEHPLAVLARGLIADD